MYLVVLTWTLNLLVITSKEEEV